MSGFKISIVPGHGCGWMFEVRRADGVSNGRLVVAGHHKGDRRGARKTAKQALQRKMPHLARHR